jgi:hypothetical protein
MRRRGWIAKCNPPDADLKPAGTSISRKSLPIKDLYRCYPCRHPICNQSWAEVILSVKELTVIDLIFVLTTLGFFALAWAYVRGCGQM